MDWFEQQRALGSAKERRWRRIVHLLHSTLLYGATFKSVEESVEYNREVYSQCRVNILLQKIQINSFTQGRKVQATRLKNSQPNTLDCITLPDGVQWTLCPLCSVFSVQCSVFSVQWTPSGRVNTVQCHPVPGQWLVGVGVVFGWQESANQHYYNSYLATSWDEIRTKLKPSNVWINTSKIFVPGSSDTPINHNISSVHSCIDFECSSLKVRVTTEEFNNIQTVSTFDFRQTLNRHL